MEQAARTMKLGVNIDHVATIRQARGTVYPDLVEAANIVLSAGADSLVIHLREDRRHIQDDDLRILRESVKIPLNLEMGLADEIVAIALKTTPDRVTLVPEKREELTTEGGLNVRGDYQRIRKAVERFHDADISVSLFVDPDREQLIASAETGATSVEIHTGAYANLEGSLALDECERIQKAAVEAEQLGLFVAGGHGLHYENVMPIASIPAIQELNIGHAIVAHALFVGLEAAVSEMKKLISIQK